jgi:hypothetical protein
MLLFYNEDKEVISKERSSLTVKKRGGRELLPDDSFILKGIITDNTKTRIGKDFYDKYIINDININGNEIAMIDRRT